MSTDARPFLGNNQIRTDEWKLKPAPPWRRFDEGEHRDAGLIYLAVEKDEPESEDLKNRNEIREMVNAAILLRRPLLVTGNPGVGKSSLARTIAYELNLGNVLVWPINTKSTLQQGLYNYDAIGRLQSTSQIAADREARLRAIQLGEEAPKIDPNDEARRTQIGRFIRLGPLGTAFCGLPHGTGIRPRVLLIDEIDKSDIDFPNELLNVFEERYFDIDEIARLTTDEDVVVGAHGGGEATVPASGRVRAQEFPIVIMTSNNEREFPAAFKRRCLQLDVKAPGRATLEKIIKTRLDKDPNDAEVKELLDQFERLTKEGKELHSVDQLMQAVHMLKLGINPLQIPILNKELFRDLKDSR
jgi:MoxR-like ATPase